MAYVLSGVCRNISDVPVAGAIVKVFDTATDTLQVTVTSNGAGAYSAPVVIPGPFYAVGYLNGVPDIAGTTVNTLMASIVGGGGAGGTPLGLLLVITTSSGGVGAGSGSPVGLLIAITKA